MIRELVDEGLFILGVPDKKAASGFKPWDLPLDEAMAMIEHKYVTNFEDRWNWVTCAWLALTDKGKSAGAAGCITPTTRNSASMQRLRASQRASWPLGVATVPSSPPMITTPPTITLPTA